MNRFIKVAAAALCAACALPASAGDFVPGSNSSALARSFALPALGDSRVLAPGKGDFRATLDFANEYVSEGYTTTGACPGECILLDGETARLSLAYRYGLGSGWDLGVNVPVLSRSGGFMDSWIQQWHGWFGLPNGGREFAARGQYRYRYQRGGATLLDVTDTGNCIGDVDLTVGRALGWDASLRGMAKVPSGDGKALCGGNAGGALWLDAALPVPKPWSAFVAAGYSVNARSYVLGNMQNRQIPFGGAAVLLPITDDVRILAQLQVHGHLYKGSTLSPFERIGAPLTLGLNIRASKSIYVDLGFQEDPSVNASPDFDAYLSLCYRE